MTIYENKQLVGCIGTYYPKHQEINEKIINQTEISTTDSRFSYNLGYFYQKPNIETTITLLGPTIKYSINDAKLRYIAELHGVVLYCDGQLKSTYLLQVMIEQKWLENNKLSDKVIEELKNKAWAHNCKIVQIGLYVGYEIDSNN